MMVRVEDGNRGGPWYKWGWLIGGECGVVVWSTGAIEVRSHRSDGITAQLNDAELGEVAFACRTLASTGRLPEHVYCGEEGVE